MVGSIAPWERAPERPWFPDGAWGAAAPAAESLGCPVLGDKRQSKRSGAPTLGGCRGLTRAGDTTTQPLTDPFPSTPNRGENRKGRERLGFR